MTTSTTRAEGRARGGFTLVEVLVSITIGLFLLTAVLGTVIYLTRSGVQLTQYAEMDAQIRRAVDRLGNDLKTATAITWNGASDITLTVPDASGGSSLVTYAWSPGSQSFFTVPGASSTSMNGRVDLIWNTPTQGDGSPGVSFARYDRDGVAATTDAATKRIQISITTYRRSSPVLAPVSSTGSTSFILRNKGVSP